MPAPSTPFPCEVDAHCASSNEYVCFERRCRLASELPPRARLDGGHTPDDAGSEDAGLVDAGQPVDASAGDAADASLVDDAGPEDGGDAGDGGDDGGEADGGPADGGDDDAGAPDAGGEPWWNPAFAVRWPLTIDVTDIAGALSDVPVPVRLSPATVDYTKIAEGGADLRFVQDGALLPHEIETWDVLGESVVWVRVASLPATGTATFHLYASGPVESPPAPTDVWSNDFQAVYHLNRDAQDSSANALHGAFNGATSSAAGPFAEARVFHGQSFMSVGPNPLLRGAAEATLSAFARPDDLAGESELCLVSVAVGGESASTLSRAVLNVDGPTKHWEAGGRANDNEGAFSGVIAKSGPAEGVLVHVAARIRYATNEVEIFVDGVKLEHTGAVGFTAGSASDTDAQAFVIGAEDDGGGSFFRGLLDEVRVAGAWRDDAWLRLEARSRHAGFVAIGPREER